MLRRFLPLALAAGLGACKNPQPCPSPLVECAGQCVDTQSDPRFCGSCGTACRYPDVCAAGACSPDTQGPCPDRVGGAFVTIGYPNGASPACAGQVVKLWVRSATFLDEAVSYVGSTSPARLPVLEVVAGTDCDGTWSWHADATTATFAAAAPSASCAACPTGIQANVPAYEASVGRWCPAGARILAVDRRSP